MLRDLIEQLPPEHRKKLSAEREQRILRLAEISPLYQQFILNEPDVIDRLEEGSFAGNFQSMLNQWRQYSGAMDSDNPAHLERLRRFRRRISLCIAYRDVNEIASCATTVRELSRLAEFCVRECYGIARRQWGRRYGEPWDEERERAAAFCVLALGKLGGEELNFSSDIDLIYFYEGEGYCRKDENKVTSFTNSQFFTKVAETMTTFLQEQTAEGFLFRTDLRLRPEGARSPLVRSFSGMENYYALAGQTWERMALIKTRPIAGDLSLGGELMESLHSFRYPRHPPPFLLTEIGAMKVRTEKEVVGKENLSLDIKSGYGGIREIEFVVQTLQLVHAGRFPFLQSHSTIEALEQLARYNLMEEEEALFLNEAYWFFRSVENRVQMREEQQTHMLPGRDEEKRSFARSFGYSDWETFSSRLTPLRDRVHAIYADLLGASPVDEEFNNWWLFFTGEKVTATIQERLDQWFGRREEAADELRCFVRGNGNRQLTRDPVTRFQEMAKTFDSVMPSLSSPLLLLKRISFFAERYGSRSHFFQICSSNPQFFQVIALLLDRSRFIYETLCQNPEILDEVLRPEILKRRKSREDTMEELRRAEDVEDFRDWLWLYVRAEQIRIASGELLGFLTADEGTDNLNALAEAVVVHTLEKKPPTGKLLPVALGKLGGGELTFGADLDLIFIGEEAFLAEQEKTIRSLLTLLSTRGPTGPIYEIDLRLRPHGNAGPLVTTLPALKRYHQGGAQSWEKQILTRARPLEPESPLAGEFAAFIDNLLYSRAVDPGVIEELWGMRLRIQNERDRVIPRERAFKTGEGGMIDLEFLAQFYQLKLGFQHPSLREPRTRKVLEALKTQKIIAPETAETLLDNFHFLKLIESNLRRNSNTGVSVIPGEKTEQEALASWMGYDTFETFWKEYRSRLQTIRKTVTDLLLNDLSLPLESLQIQDSQT